MLYFHRRMKKLTRPLLILCISTLLVFLSVAFSASTNLQPTALKQFTGGVLAVQLTATPEPVEAEDQSVVGSTDGITMLSFVIVAIILIPIFMKRRDWDASLN